MPVGRSQSDLRPFVYLSIGDIVIPTWQYLVSFSFQAQTQALGSTGTLTLFDPDWDYLEYLILQNRLSDQIQIQFGWEHGEVSPRFKARFMDVKPNFSSQGVTLNATFSTTDYVNNPKDYSFPPGTKTSDIARQVMIENGWREGRIEETKEILYPLNIRGMTARQFVVQLAEIAVNTNGVGSYRAYFEGDAFYFISAQSAVNKTIQRSYTLYADRQGDLLQFDVGDEITLMGSLGAGGATGQGLDPENKAVYSVTVNNSENSDGVPRFGDRGRGVSSGTMRAWTDDPNALAARESMRRRYTEISHSFTASASIMGDPNLRMLEYIRIMIFKPNAEAHHLSGIYRIDEIDHQISAGSYTSQLSLWKDSDPLSADLLSGKYVDEAQFKQEELASGRRNLIDVATDVSLDGVVGSALRFFR